jgi:3-hydroxyacyl-CoA dehydrogenase
VANLPDRLSLAWEADVAVLHISARPELQGVVAGLAAIVNVLNAIQLDLTAGAIVLGGPAAFVDEGDLTDCDADFRALRQTITNSAVPVIAAISRSALGSGLALVPSCRFRVAFASARLGFPGIRAGTLATGDVVRLGSTSCHCRTRSNCWRSGQP